MKTTSALDLVKLAKVLQLSTTDNDPEALACIRRANEMLQRRGLSWSQIVSSPAAPAPESTGHVPPPPPRTPKNWADVEPEPELDPEHIENMFAVLRYNRPAGSAAGFIDSLESQWTDEKWLSAKQLSALTKFYQNAQRPPRRRNWERSW